MSNIKAKGITILNVYIKWVKNKASCICLMDQEQSCHNDQCEADKVTHNVYRDIIDCFKQDRYGK